MTPLRFFEDARRAYADAEHAVGAAEYSFRVAGQVVGLRFAGRALVPRIVPALARAVVHTEETPTLTVCLWDAASTGTTVPRLPWTGHSLSRRGDIQGFTSSQVRTAFDRSADLLSLFDAQRRLALFCARAADLVPMHETAAPLATIFSWWLHERGLHLAHAGAIGRDEGGILLVGRGGSGKSTTALACLGSGLAYVADDRCIVAAGTAARVWGLYGSAKLTRESVERLGLHAAVTNPERLDREKGLLFIGDARGQAFPGGVPLRAIVMPRVTPRPASRLSVAPAAAAAGPLALGSAIQFPGAGDALLRDLTGLCQRTPCYHLELGSDLARLPGLLEGLLDEVASAGSPRACG